MPNTKNYLVTKRDDGWQVKKEDGKRASSIHDTQANAWKEAKRLAQQSKVEAILKGEDGKIRERNSYGNDPFPPKG